MKPTRSQKVYIQKYFRRILGYGNKCGKCQKIGSIKNVTENLIEFHCIVCNRSWAFETKESINDLLLKGMGLKDN